MKLEIREGVKEAFTLQYGEIEAAAYEEWPRITFEDAVSIMLALSDNLWHYRRAPDERFILWAKAWVKRQARRYRFLVEQLPKYRRVITKPITTGLYLAPEDWAIELNDHIANPQLHLLQNPRKIDGLLNPKRAKPSTMLYEMEKWQMRAHCDKVGGRAAIVKRRMAGFLDSPGIHIADKPEPNEDHEKDSMTQKIFG